MTPINFPESNQSLSRPDGTTEKQCSSLSILQTGDFCISCWPGTWRDRLRFLFTGRCWLSVWSGVTQPPVKVTTEEPFNQSKSRLKDHAGSINVLT